VGVLSIQSSAQREQEQQEVRSTLHKKRLVSVVG
jgi:hypothetical protein